MASLGKESDMQVILRIMDVQQWLHAVGILEAHHRR